DCCRGIAGPVPPPLSSVTRTPPLPGVGASGNSGANDGRPALFNSQSIVLSPREDVPACRASAAGSAKGRIALRLHSTAPADSPQQESGTGPVRPVQEEGAEPWPEICICPLHFGTADHYHRD